MAEHIRQRFSSPGPKRILALDGGGTRGIITLAFLKEIETTLRTKLKKPDLVLSDYFDLIGGTSVGAMLATMLALGRDVDTVRARFNEWAPRIFAPSLIGRVRRYFSAKFDARVLRGLVQQEVRDLPLRTDQLRTGLCIVAKRVDTGSVWPIINNPADPYFEGRPATGNTEPRRANGDFLLLDLVRASTAAPTFFSPSRLRLFGADDILETEREMGVFIDGAVSPHNSPDLQLFMMAGISGYNLGGGSLDARRPWELGADKLLIVSVGTGTHKSVVVPSSMAAFEAIDALQGVISDSQLLNLALLQWMSDSKTEPIWPIDRVMGSLAEDVLGRDLGLRQPLLSYRRYDVRLETNWLAEAVGERIPAGRLATIRDFTDMTEHSERARIGERVAKTQVKPDHFPVSFDAVWNKGATLAA